MSIDLKVPVLPESVSDATVLAWRKTPGEAVKRDEALVDIETDKVVIEVPSPADGVLAEIVEAEGTTVTAGQIIGRLGSGAAAESAQGGSAASLRDRPAKPGSHGQEARRRPEEAAEPPASESPPLSPSVRRLVAEHGFDPAQIPASGRGGRLLKEDVLAHLDAERTASVSAASTRDSPAEPVSHERPAIEAAPAAGRPERRERMSRLRARVAERLVEAQHNAATLTTFNEIDMHAVMGLRARHREAFEKRHGVKLGFMSFFVRAVTEALRRFPVINASIDDGDIVYHGYYDIGIAVSSPRGLVVPVLRDADTRSIADIERAIADFVVKARDGTLDIADITGGNFTITNGGVFGSLLSTPIINPPQSAILGMHRIQERPVAIDGQVVIRPMMYIALSYDHRLIDGREAVSFLIAVKEYIEAPERLLLES